jgi:hypothetical protein
MDRRELLDYLLFVFPERTREFSCMSKRALQKEFAGQDHNQTEKEQDAMRECDITEPPSNADYDKLLLECKRPMEYRITTRLRPGMTFHQALPAVPRFLATNGERLYSIRWAHLFRTIASPKFPDCLSLLNVDAVPPGTFHGTFYETQGKDPRHGIQWDGPFQGPTQYISDDVLLRSERRLVPVSIPTSQNLSDWTGLLRDLCSMVLSYWVYEPQPTYTLVNDAPIASRLRKRKRTF